MHNDHNEEYMKRANGVAEKILDSAFKLHRQYGPGLLESAYEHLLVYELTRNQGLKVE